MTSRTLALGALAIATAIGLIAAAMRALIRRRRAAQGAARRQVRCECGQEYVVVGADRHRVYWLAGAAKDDPVLGDRCPVCEAPLPGERHPAAA